MQDGIILWEAHRAGAGGNEMPESCHAAFEYGWTVGGRPEADVNMTADGVMVSVHDNTLDRIVPDLPEKWKGKTIGELTWDQVRSCNVGWGEFPRQRVASIEELLAILQQHPERHMVIDYKRVERPLLADMIKRYGVNSQITFASSQRELCREMHSLVPGIRTKNWLGGSAEAIMEKFAVLKQENFTGITEVQLHLNDVPERAPGAWRYALPPEFIREALQICKDNAILLQTLPWFFEKADMDALLDLGVRSFAVDFPGKFLRLTSAYFTAHYLD